MMCKENTHDDILLEKLQAGDRTEFARLVERYSEYIYKLAVKMLGNELDAEDVLQETFLKAFRSIDTFKGNANISTWLYRIAANEALMMIRKRRSDIYPVEIDRDEDEEDQYPLDIVDWGALPEEDLLTSENMEYLNRLVQSLSPALRLVFLLRDVMELSVRESADVLGVSENVVKTRLSRARLQLRQQLSQYFSQHQQDRGGIDGKLN